MKRYTSVIISVIILLSLVACISNSDQMTDTANVNELDSLEYVGSESSSYIKDINTFADLCSSSNTIVKAKYKGKVEYNASTSVFLFEVEVDFTDSVDEDIMHIHESSQSVFIEGKSYYLFATGIRNALYPYVRYIRILPNFLVGIDESGFEKCNSFYQQNFLDVENVKDFDQYIDTEVIQPQKYKTDSELFIRESVETAYEKADCVLLVTITAVEPENKYVAHCAYKIDKSIKGEYMNSGLTQKESEDSGFVNITPGPATAEVGDQLILLFKYDPERKSTIMYSAENFIFTPESDGGQYILSNNSNFADAE